MTNDEFAERLQTVCPLMDKAKSLLQKAQVFKSEGGVHDPDHAEALRQAMQAMKLARERLEAG